MTTEVPASSDKASARVGYGDYMRFSRLMQVLYGLDFPERRRSDLEYGLLQAFAASPCVNLDEYYHLLLDPVRGGIYKQRLVNALTIGESHFFRNAGQFDALYRQVLPEIIERRRSLHTLRIWSAGCAGGQEPYSIAMMLRELLPDVDDWAVTILGTDVNTSALDQAQRAVYSDWAFREPQALQLRPRYFRLVGKRYELRPEVRRMVSFAQLNLADAYYPSFQTNTMFLDLILCRNVAIYFAPAVTQTVIARFYDALVDGGWLAVGHSEHSAARFRQFQVHAYPNAILYQRTGQPVDQEVDWNRPSPPSEPVAVQTTETPSVAHATQTPVCEVKPESNEEDLQGENLLDRARDLLTYGHSEEVRDLLMETLDAGPERADSCALLGQAYANLGDWSAAETWCRRAVQLDQLMEDPYYTLALVLQHQGHLEQALATMKKVVYLNSNSERGHYGLANLYYSLGQLPQALKSLDNARRLMADRAESEVLLGTGGLTIGHLRQAIVMQQQQWSTEAAARNRT